MVDTTATIICDSVGEHSPRLTTFLLRYPKFVHAEHCRHRSFSLAVSSSRAIPVSKNQEEVRSDDMRAGPVYWATEQKGMSGGNELDNEEKFHPENRGYYAPKTYAMNVWREAAWSASMHAERLVAIGVHKSIVNRLLEPFLHVNVLATCCEPGLLNFFGLRLDKAAQPEIRAVAEAMWRAWNESDPKKLVTGQWHLPFIEDQDRAVVAERADFHFDTAEHDNLIKISVARCARLSYTSYETKKRSTIDEDLALNQRLVGAQPIHASPAEHQATPDVLTKLEGEMPGTLYPVWDRPELHGNLPGWRQYRKTLPGEACAPLPWDVATEV